MSFLNVSGPNIRKVRLAKGWTQGRLAQELEVCNLGLTTAIISRIERRQRIVNDQELTLIAIALGVSVDDLAPSNAASSENVI